MLGYLIPRSYMAAMQFDSENKNSKWYDAITLDMESMLEYKVYKKWYFYPKEISLGEGFHQEHLMEGI